MSGERSFTDSRGLTWTVYELPRSRIEFDERLVETTPAHLTFELGTGASRVLRRVSHYPPDWRALDDEALEVLCDSAGGASIPLWRTESGELRRHLDDLST
jgi:hypothetical protein